MVTQFKEIGEEIEKGDVLAKERRERRTSFRDKSEDTRQDQLLKRSSMDFLEKQQEVEKEAARYGRMSGRSMLFAR